MGLRFMLLACALGACSPFGGGAFECSLDTECNGGSCSSGFCSFADSDCPSGLRFGDLSGPNSGQCVGGGGGGSDSGMPDTALDAFVAPDGRSCYGTGLVTACFSAPPASPVTLDANIDTGTSLLCDDDPANSAWCVIAGSSITQSGTVTVIGTKPLVLVSMTTVTINGTLEIASHRIGGIVAAGANAVGCSAGTAPGTSGGGAGGSFGALGGAGGGTNLTATAGGVAGIAMAAPNALRGGCAGQNGNAGTPGTGGAGGGALYMIAETQINVIGSVNASGASGTNGVTTIAGGGGGGSGGMIGLDSPIVTGGTIFANGGGGGEGSGNTTAGAPGNDPLSGAGGVGGSALSTNGGDGGGGQGGTTTNPGAGANGTATGGGGGGGGSVGVIKLHRASSISGGIVSPAPS